MAGEVKLKKVRNSFEKLLQPILNLENENVQVGHFEEQGEHYSGYTYAELMKIHHYGQDPTGEVEMPTRPLLDYVFYSNKGLKDPQIKKAFNAWARRTPSEQSNAKLLEDLGQVIATKEKQMFGQSPPLAANADGKPGGSNPLVLTGDLRDKTAYKTSKTKVVKEV